MGKASVSLAEGQVDSLAMLLADSLVMYPEFSQSEVQVMYLVDFPVEEFSQSEAQVMYLVDFLVEEVSQEADLVLKVEDRVQCSYPDHHHK